MAIAETHGNTCTNRGARAGQITMIVVVGPFYNSCILKETEGEQNQPPNELHVGTETVIYLSFASLFSDFFFRF